MLCGKLHSQKVFSFFYYIPTETELGGGAHQRVPIRVQEREPDLACHSAQRRVRAHHALNHLLFAHLIWKES